MAIVTFILGYSGTGKSYSLRNLPKTHTGIVRAIGKPLPFRGSAAFNGIVSDQAAHIIKALQVSKADILVIDDFQYIMANEFMKRSHEKGFDKFTDIGRNTWEILNTANNLAPNKRVYILSHLEQGESGKEKIKTIGKLLDEKITLEGMVSIVLKTIVQDGQYLFTTQNNGNDSTKSPEGMFDNLLIDNDLNAVDMAICDYYGITRQDADQEAAKPTQEKQANEQTLQAQAAEQPAFEEAEGF